MPAAHHGLGSPVECRCPECDGGSLARYITVEEIETVDGFLEHTYEEGTYLESQGGKSLELLEHRVHGYTCLDCGADLQEDALVKDEVGPGGRSA